MVENVVAVIPARGGSKRFPKKNVKMLADLPLIAYSIKAAINSEVINRIVISTDDDEIAQVVTNYPEAEVIRRPEEFATDEAKTISAVQHAIDFLEENNSYRPDLVVMLQPTCPLREKGFIDNAIKLLVGSDADSLLGVTEERYKLGEIKNSYFEPHYEEGLRKQDLGIIHRESGALYITRTETIKNGSFFGEKIIPYIVNKYNAINIDTQFEFDIAETMLSKHKDKFIGGAL